MSDSQHYLTAITLSLLCLPKHRCFSAPDPLILYLCANQLPVPRPSGLVCHECGFHRRACEPRSTTTVSLFNGVFICASHKCVSVSPSSLFLNCRLSGSIKWVFYIHTSTLWSLQPPPQPHIKWPHQAERQKVIHSDFNLNNVKRVLRHNCYSDLSFRLICFRFPFNDALRQIHLWRTRRMSS